MEMCEGKDWFSTYERAETDIVRARINKDPFGPIWQKD